MNVLALHAARRADLTRGLHSGARLVARFGIIGLLAFVVDVGVFNLVRHVADQGPLTSKTVSVVVATTFSFFGNMRWTFSERRRRHPGAAYVLFFASNGVGLLISLVCLAISSYVLGLTSPLAENISSNVVGLGLGTLFRFWVYHRWVFPETVAADESAVDRDEHAHLGGTGTASVRTGGTSDRRRPATALDQVEPDDDRGSEALVPSARGHGGEGQIVAIRNEKFRGSNPLSSSRGCTVSSQSALSIPLSAQQRCLSAGLGGPRVSRAPAGHGHQLSRQAIGTDPHHDSLDPRTPLPAAS